MSLILLVEDNELNRDMLSRRLIKRGFVVEFAVHGQDALDQARKLKPDLILMDMNLPVLDGWSVTRVLKSDPDTGSIPVIALTAHAMEADKEKCLQAGCNDFDTKPVEFKRLLAIINRWIDKGTADG